MRERRFPQATATGRLWSLGFTAFAASDRPSGAPAARVGASALAFLILASFVLTTTVSRAQETLTRNSLAQAERNAEESEPEIEGEPDEGQSFAYQVSIEGDFGEDLGTLLRDVSQLERQADRPPLTAAALATRVEGDIERLRTALRSEGFYDPTVESEIDVDARPVQIRLQVETGPRYTLETYEISYQGTPPEERVRREVGEASVETGKPAEAKEIKAAESRIVNRLRNRGHPFAEIVGSRYVVDHATRTMKAELEVDAGPAAEFGALEIEGLEDVAPDHAEEVANWSPGERYDARRLESLRQSLSGTGLFDSVVIKEGEELGPDGRLPVTATVIERAPRSIGGGLAYSSADGFSVNAFWEHRNLFDRAENLRLEGIFSLNRQEARADFRKPYFFARNQSLLLDSSVVRQKDEAFDELSTSFFGGIERTYGDRWTASLGASLELIRITEDGTTRDYGLLGVPVSLSYDDRDDPLDPTEGFTFTASTTPYFGVKGDAEKFWVNEIRATAYLSLDSDGDFVLAGRTRLGSILGSDRRELPASKRFYSGGGGSVRGYEFRSVGPLDSDDEPLGGRSVLEGGLELRAKVTEDIGLVPFIEGGQVSTDPYPDFGGKVLWAAGLGVRYYTAIGPVRLDVAFPINGRPVDDTFQFYVSIGQAF